MKQQGRRKLRGLAAVFTVILGGSLPACFLPDTVVEPEVTASARFLYFSERDRRAERGAWRTCAIGQCVTGYDFIDEAGWCAVAHEDSWRGCARDARSGLCGCITSDAVFNVDVPVFVAECESAADAGLWSWGGPPCPDGNGP